MRKLWRFLQRLRPQGFPGFENFHIASTASIGDHGSQGTSTAFHTTVRKIVENSVEVVEAFRSGLQEFLQILPRAVLPGRIDGVGDVPDDLGELGLLFHHLFHPVDGVEDGGVVTAAELLADLRQR